MQSARKVTLVPPKNLQIGGGEDNNIESGLLSSQVEQTTDKIKSKIYDKIHRFIKVILRLARTVGYDDDLRIRLKNGKYLEKSNIVDLLTHAMSVGKVLYGENEFIELLAESGVDPDLIINDNVKLKLMQFKNIRKSIVEEKEQIININPRKRKASVEEDEVLELPARKIKAVNRGNKKFITVNEDGGILELSAPKPPPLQAKRRKVETVDVSNEDMDLENDENKEYEIEKVLKRRIKNGRKEVFVKWLNYPDSDNSWIPDTNVNYPGGESSAVASSTKRNISEVDEDEDTVDDDMIDETRWKIN